MRNSFWHALPSALPLAVNFNWSNQTERKLYMCNSIAIMCLVAHSTLKRKNLETKQTHYNLTLKILSPFSFQPRLIRNASWPLCHWRSTLIRNGTEALEASRTVCLVSQSVVKRKSLQTNPNPS